MKILAMTLFGLVLCGPVLADSPRLAPYVEGIHGKTTVAAVDFPGT
ncbi:MAG: hypothetical protein IH927_00450 [Proteobacteria bacterium]|nr:hypothetical protein [Pseudomonadota bacterium]